MNDETVSRRKFLLSGAAVTAAPAILVFEARSAESPELSNPESSAFSPVTTTAVQTLENKTISSHPAYGNILGTDYVNVREFLLPLAGNDITDALNDAIDSLKNTGAAMNVARGGVILIPRGQWVSRGGHDLFSTISIEGVGSFNVPTFYDLPWGTELRFINSMEMGQPDYLFRVESQHNCSIKNMSIISEKEDSIGLLVTNQIITEAWLGNVRNICVENVSFDTFEYGIKFQTTPTKTEPYAEFLPNRFERVNFNDCANSFYCNSANSGFSFDTCTFYIPENGTALNCPDVGNLSVNHCLFLSIRQKGGVQTNNSCVLRTLNAFNNISFYDCQDEWVQYAYQNGGNYYEWVPITYTHCLIQSKFKLSGNGTGSIILDSCRVHGALDNYSLNTIVAPFEDTATAYVQVYLKGRTSFFGGTPPTYVSNGRPVPNFTHSFSALIFEPQYIGAPKVMSPSDTASPSYIFNESRAIVLIDTGVSGISIYHDRVHVDSLVFAQLLTQDLGNAQVREVVCFPGEIQIRLTAAASNKLRVGVKIEL